MPHAMPCDPRQPGDADTPCAPCPGPLDPIPPQPPDPGPAPSGFDPTEPTAFLPGSWGKLETLAWRAAARQPLFVSGDGGQTCVEVEPRSVGPDRPLPGSTVCRRKGRWLARIQEGGCWRHLGTFRTRAEAEAEVRAEMRAA